MRWIYLSPHLDDAVFSAGGLIYEKVRAGLQVEIWTVVCGFPPPGELPPLAQELHAQWGTGTAEQTVRLRREEDVRAAGYLGARTIHMDIPDCIYRVGPQGAVLYQDIFVRPHPFEANLPAEIAETLSGLVQPDDQLVCQLAIGGHVDHILVRKAVEQLGHPLWYAADLPYHFKHPEELGSMTSRLHVTRHPLSEPALAAWQEAILIYASQLSAVFEDLEAIEADIRAFIQEWGGFPLWQQA